MTRKDDAVGVDAPDTTRDEATELMVHHLQLAAMYFEATPESDAETREEVRRLLADDDRALAGALPFYEALVAHYDAMKDD